MNKKKEVNPYNNVGISFASEVALLEKGKKRMRELGLRSFSEYVKQLIKYDLGLPNIISAYIGKTIEDKKAEDALIAAFLAEERRSKTRFNRIGRGTIRENSAEKDFC